jgi:hypothetical protein
MNEEHLSGDVKMNKDIPPCQADGARNIRMVRINGIQTGITMLDEIIVEVKGMHLTSDQQIRDSLMKMVKRYNYIPMTAEDAYLKAILGEYHSGTSS